MFHFTARPAVHADMKAVCKICRDALNTELPQKELERVYTEIIEDVSQMVMVSVHSGHVAGFIHARRVFDMVLGEHAEIVSAAMNPYYRGKGGGKLMLAGIEAWSSQMLAPKIICVLKSENEVFKTLLQNNGYVRGGFGAFEKTLV